MKKLNLSIVILLLFISSCSKNENLEDNLNVSDDNHNVERYSFVNNEELNQKIYELGMLNQEEIESWAMNENPNALLFSIKNNLIVNDYYESLPLSYQALFNEEGEITLGDEIIFLKEGKLYSFAKKKYSKNNKENLSSQNEIGSISISKVALKNAETTEKVFLDGNDKTFSYQHEFRGNYQKDCSGKLTTMGTSKVKYKYVHELVTVQRIIDRYVAISELYLVVKLENRYKRRSWKRAGNKRDIVVSMNINASLKNNGLTIPISGSDIINKTYNCSENQSVLLKYTPTSYDIGFTGNRPLWEITTTGTVKQSIRGGYNSWTGAANW